MHQRCVHPGPLVLGTAPFKYPAPTTDRDRTVSRRSEPSSRTALIGEQPNPSGSLTPTFVSARPVSLAVRLAYAFALFRLVSVQTEPTFERLRYSLGGDRPSQTAHLTMSPALIQGRRLEFQCRKDGIPTSAPLRPKPKLLSVPSILCMQHRNPILGYSKAPWGLSVLSRVTGIFTGTTISPGGLLRQWAVETVPKSLRLSCGSELT